MWTRSGISSSFRRYGHSITRSILNGCRVGVPNELRMNRRRNRQVSVKKVAQAVASLPRKTPSPEDIACYSSASLQLLVGQKFHALRRLVPSECRDPSISTATVELKALLIIDGHR